MDFYQSGATAAAGFNARGSMSADNRARRTPAEEATPATPKREQQPPNDDEINRFRGNNRLVKSI